MNYSLLKLFAVILLAIFCGEWVTMLFLRVYSEVEFPLFVVVLDSSILTCLVFPVLYFFHHRPLCASLHQLKRAERSLVKSKERFKKIFENSPLGISLLSREWKYVDVNPAMEEIMGFSREELVGNTPAMITHPEYLDKNINLFDELLAGKRSGYSFEKKYIRKDGSEIWCKLSVSFYSEAAPQENTFIIAMMENVTDSKAVERRLAESQAMLAEAEKLANIGHWKWTEEPGDIAWSEQMFRIMGFEPGAVLPSLEKQRGVYVANGWSRILKCRERVYRSGTSETVQATVRGADGEKRQVLHNVRAERDQSGKVAALFGTCQDISETVQREVRLKRAGEEAEKATRLKDKFVALVAHDLQGPSTANTNLIQLILQDKETPPRDEHREILDNILHSCLRMNILVKDVLNIGRLKTGSMQIRKRSLNVRNMIEQVLTGLMVGINSKGVRFFNDIPQDSIVLADETLLSQVVENIITNALKFSSKGDSVHIFEPEGDVTTIAVRDTGVGMTQETLRHIFRYEWGASMPGTAGEIGTGLGLPFSNDIITAHGGRITVESKEGAGSTIYLELPHVKPLVLIVDDEKIFIEEQKIHLSELDIDVIEAGNGERALQLLKVRKPQLIITDVKMPVMDGLKFLEAVRANPETSKIPVIVVTGFEGMDIRNRAFKKGADDFVQKPFEVDELIPRVKRFVG